MGLNCGIVGLPNVGKSTIFRALTSAPAEAANYPFCTIEPNVGIVNLPDERLGKISKIIGPQKILPSVVEFVDIAGLVKGASKGEGLGNQFLGHIRQTGAIAHVVRCFEDPNIVHVNGKIDPEGDVETINLELAFSDLETVQKKHMSNQRAIKSQDKKISSKAKIMQGLLERLEKFLEEGKPARLIEFDDVEREILKELHLITMKPILYVCNVSEDDINTENDHVRKVREIAKKEGAGVIQICGSIEAEISDLETEEEKQEFLKDLGLETSGLDRLIKKAFEMLGLKTYFTAGEKEVRAWTFTDGSKAPQAAGVIHTDFERGFIKAEVYHCDDLFTLGSEQKVKENGKFRIEGKDYIVKDGDIIHFRFNV